MHESMSIEYDCMLIVCCYAGVCRLTANPAFGKEDRSLEGPEPAPYMCPVTLQEMNGAHSFIVLFNTGWVMAEKATKEVGIAGLQVTSRTYAGGV